MESAIAKNDNIYYAYFNVMFLWEVKSLHIHTSNQESLSLGFGNYTCNWGTHLCGLYENAEERDEILLGFLHRGDIDGDLQLYCPSERSRDDFFQAYGCLFPDCENHLHQSDRFQISTAKELYYPDGIFSPWKMDQNLTAFYRESQENGRRNIRATAEMTWALDAIPGREHLMAYESRLNYFIPGKPWISICLYNINKFSGSTILEVLQTHPFTINKDGITENPYYQNPDEWLAQHAPEFLN